MKRNWHLLPLNESSVNGKESIFFPLPVIVRYKSQDEPDPQWYFAWLKWCLAYVNDPLTEEDGWKKYQHDKRDTFPDRVGKYLTCSKDKTKYRVLFWGGLGWSEADSTIGYYQKINPVPKKPF